MCHIYFFSVFFVRLKLVCNSLLKFTTKMKTYIFSSWLIHKNIAIFSCVSVFISVCVWVCIYVWCEWVSCFNESASHVWKHIKLYMDILLAKGNPSRAEKFVIKKKIIILDLYFRIHKQFSFFIIGKICSQLSMRLLMFKQIIRLLDETKLT